MKQSPNSGNRTRLSRRGPGSIATLAVTLPIAMGWSTVRAQVADRPAQLEAPAASRLINQEQSKAALTPGSGLYLDPSSFLRWGPITARPHFNASVSYNSGLRSRAGNGESVVSETIAPGVLFQLGPKWVLDYTPSMTFYDSAGFEDSLSHSVSFSGGTTFEEWSFSLSQTYSTSFQSLLETGRQTHQENFGTSISASRYLSSKLMLQLSVNQGINAAEEFTSSRSWSTTEWLNYQIASRISIGAGVGGGYEDVNVGHDMTYESINARVDVRIAQKLNLSVSGGGQIRQIQGTDEDSLINPTYNASIIYQPFTYTTLSLTGNRTVSASLLAGQITEGTSISLGLNQRLLGALSGSLGASFHNTRFVFATTGADLSREDDAFTFSAGLGYTLLERISLGLGYSLTENTSSTEAFSSSSHSVSFNLGYTF